MKGSKTIRTMAICAIVAMLVAIIGCTMRCTPLQAGVMATAGWFLRGLLADLEIKL
jgi:hypothetical protein